MRRQDLVRRRQSEVPASPAKPGSFRGLVGEAAWRRLPRPVQARFERELAPGESAVFVGEVAETRMTLVGRLWAQVARLAGSPLPLRAIARATAAVVVTEDADRTG